MPTGTVCEEVKLFNHQAKEISFKRIQFMLGKLQDLQAGKPMTQYDHRRICDSICSQVDVGEQKRQFQGDKKKKHKSKAETAEKVIAKDKKHLSGYVTFSKQEIDKAYGPVEKALGVASGSGVSASALA